MMATACGSQGLEPIAPVDFDQARPQPIDVAGLAQSPDNQSNAQESPRTALPLPNPPFVFPAQHPPSSAPSSYSRASGRRPRSAIESSDRQFCLGDDSDASSASRSPALPAFSFNPGASLSPDNAMLSPPLSPQSPRAIPTRPGGHGHRRGGSEFVGGSIRSGDAIAVMSTSPTKSESGFASPTLPPPRPAGRRGHAHRRSAALSSHDLSTIMNPTSPNPASTGTNPPRSPAELGRETPQPEPRKHTVPESLVINTSQRRSVSENEPTIDTPAPAKSASRVRVGFSDNIEYIPRPLSLVSNDTSSTITARPGHSVSGSISSVVSGPIFTPVEPEVVVPLAPSSSRVVPESRPSTAGAVLERTQSVELTDETTACPRRRNSIPLLLSVASPSSSNPASHSPTKTPKRWSFFGLEPFIGTSSPKGSRPVSSSSSESSSRQYSSANSSSEHIPEQSPEEPEKAVAKRSGKKSRRKQKKVKVWAGSLLTRRAKAKQKNKAIAAKGDTDPAPQETSEVESPQAPEPEASSVPVIPAVMVTGSPNPSDSELPRPRPASEDDGSFPVIDLDAALGPFNTPLPFNPEWEAAQRAGAPAKRKLHSAAGMSHFSGPGGHYHRRAESAPEMAPFEHARSGIHRFGSSSTMADVFEEEEEDDANQATKSEGPMSSGNDSGDLSGSTVNIQPTASQEATSGETASDTASTNQAFDDRLSDGDVSGNDSKTPAASVVEDSPAPPPMAPDAAILELSSLPPRDPCDSAEASPRRIVPLRDLAPVDVSLQLPSASLAPGSPFSMTHSSSFPSPRSPMSYDANRVSTAPSSIAEENSFQSLLMGEPGPEVRYSIDADIPSLTSSNSTMTKDSSFPPHPRSSHGNLPGQRPVSFSAAPFSRRRSSLASLSRLISSSHGEKSKLSMEVTCDSEPEKKQKHSKAKRLSRKLQFWKPTKEAPAST